MVVRRKGRIEVGLYVYTYIQTHVFEIHPHTHTHTHIYMHIHTLGFPGGRVVKNLPAITDARDSGSIPGSEIFTGVGNGNPLQDSCLENPKDRGAWWATAHGVTESAHTGPYYGPSTTLIVDLYKYLI